MLCLKKFDFLTRDQLRRHCRLGTIRNANRVFYELGDYLQSARDGYQSIYYLSKEGRAYVECEKIRKKGGHMQHSIMRSEFWLFNGCPADWKNEIKVTDGKTTIIVDAMFKKIQHHFLEVDHLQTMKENRAKIEKYKELFNTGFIAQKLGHFPAVVWLTTTELRRRQLTEGCKSLPGFKVYTMNDIN